MAELELWLRDKLVLVSQKSKLAEAIRYAITGWAGLTRFLDDGRIEIDNNVVEPASIRPIALNRKIALFAGSDGGGGALGNDRVAGRNTASSTASIPQAYLSDVIARIVAGHPQSQLEELLPWAYAKLPLRAWPENSALMSLSTLDEILFHPLASGRITMIAQRWRRGLKDVPVIKL